MALFPKEQDADQILGDAPQRMAWTRERGTRRLIGAFIALILIWYIAGQVQDHFLLQTSWSTLSPDLNGLTVVGTLDSRESYDRNMFRILQANKTSRAELTDFGWRSIFNGEGSDLFTEDAGDAIRGAISVDDVTGYAMLEPYLRVGIARLMRLPNPDAGVSRDMLISIPKTPNAKLSAGDTPGEKQETLGALLAEYRGKGGGNVAESDNSEGGSESGHQVEHGLSIPADTLAKACPVVLTGAQFSEASLDEHPASLLEGKTYTVHLYLTPEGRSRFFQWSHDHANESLVFVLDHQIATAGRIQQTLDVSDWQIGPLRDGEAAAKLVNYVNSHKH